MDHSVKIDRLRAKDWVVKDCPFSEGKRLVQLHHYAKGGSNTFVYCHGLYRKSDEKLCGVAWWLPPTRVACESVNKNNWKKVISLSRLVVVPDTPKNAASFLISGSIKLIKADKRFVTLVTYADTAEGHTGAIYKATNWEYWGETGPYPRWLSEDGKLVSPKATVNRTKAQMEAIGHRKVGSYFKHKFVMHIQPDFDVCGVEA